MEVGAYVRCFGKIYNKFCPEWMDILLSDRRNNHLDRQQDCRKVGKQEVKDHKEAIYNIMENAKSEMLWRLEKEYKRGYEDGREYEQLLRTPKHDADRLEEVKDLIRESDKIDAYTLSYPAWVFIKKLKKVVGFELTDYEERQTEKSCENCKILELLVDFELETICEDDDKDFEYCENNCNFKAPTKECYLHWAEHKRKESE